MPKDDRLWKGILEDVCDDFLTFFFPEAPTLFDFERGFDFLDKELEQLFPSDDGRHPRFVDKLIKVYTRAGIEEWILVHVEVQGYADKDFGLRMFTYFYRILDRYDKPITALAIFSDSKLPTRPTDTNIIFWVRAMFSITILTRFCFRTLSYWPLIPIRLQE